MNSTPNHLIRITTRTSIRNESVTHTTHTSADPQDVQKNYHNDYTLSPLTHTHTHTLRHIVSTLLQRPGGGQCDKHNE